MGNFYSQYQISQHKQVSKADIDSCLNSLTSHLTLLRDTYIETLKKTESSLIEKINSTSIKLPEDLNTPRYMHLVNSLTTEGLSNAKLIDSIELCNMIISFTKALASHSYDLAQAQTNIQSKGEQIPAMCTIIYSAYPLNQKSVEKFAEIVENSFDKEIVRNAEMGYYVDEKVKQITGKFMPSYKELNDYLDNFIKRNFRGNQEKYFNSVQMVQSAFQHSVVNQPQSKHQADQQQTYQPQNQYGGYGGGHQQNSYQQQQNPYVAYNSDPGTNNPYQQQQSINYGQNQNLMQSNMFNPLGNPTQPQESQDQKKGPIMPSILESKIYTPQTHSIKKSTLNPLNKPSINIYAGLIKQPQTVPQKNNATTNNPVQVFFDKFFDGHDMAYSDTESQSDTETPTISISKIANFVRLNCEDLNNNIFQSTMHFDTLSLNNENLSKVFTSKIFDYKIEEDSVDNPDNCVLPTIHEDRDMDDCEDDKNFSEKLEEEKPDPSKKPVSPKGPAKPDIEKYELRKDSAKIVGGDQFVNTNTNIRYQASISFNLQLRSTNDWLKIAFSINRYKAMFDGKEVEARMGNLNLDDEFWKEATLAQNNNLIKITGKYGNHDFVRVVTISFEEDVEKEEFDQVKPLPKKISYEAPKPKPNPQSPKKVVNNDSSQLPNRTRIDSSDEDLPEPVSTRVTSDDIPHPKNLLSSYFMKGSQLKKSTIKNFDANPQNDDTNWMIKSFNPTQPLNSLAQKLAKNSIFQSIAFVGDKQKWKDIHDPLMPIGDLYQDPDFPPSFESIWGFEEEKNFRKEKFEGYEWARPDKIFGGEPYAVYNDSPDSNDIVQGMIGDCYYLAALSSICTYKDRIKRLFLTRKVDDTGCYCVALSVNGLWEEVILDDNFPVNARSKKPIFNRCRNNELWVMLLEKAWAKICGGYLNIHLGWPREALYDITGAPARDYFIMEGTKAEHWRNLMHANKKRFIMTAGITMNPYTTETGLIQGHAYSQIAAYAIKKNGDSWSVLEEDEYVEKDGVERIVKLRNPWGKCGWEGAWSDADKRWNETLRKQLNYDDKKYGLFCMPYDLFIHYYSSYQICYYYDHYKYSAFRYRTDNNETMLFSFDIDIPGDYYFSIHQINKKFFPRKRRYLYSRCTLQLLYVDISGKPELKGCVQNVDKEAWFEANCYTQGKYYIMVTTPWKSFTNQITLNIYGPAEIALVKIDEDSMDEDWMTDVIKDRAEEESPNVNVKWVSYENEGEPDIWYKVDKNTDGIGFFCFKNNSASTTLNVTINFISKYSVKIGAPYFLNNKPTIEVGPGQTEVLWYTVTETTGGIQFQMKSQFKKLNDGLNEAILKNGQKFVRPYLGKDIGIHVNVLWHMEGYGFLYKNESENFILEENVSFEMQDCHIVDNNGRNHVKVLLKPGEKRSIFIMKEEGVSGKDFSAKFGNVIYYVNPV